MNSSLHQQTLADLVVSRTAQNQHHHSHRYSLFENLPTSSSSSSPVKSKTNNNPNTTKRITPNLSTSIIPDDKKNTNSSHYHHHPSLLPDVSTFAHTLLTEIESLRDTSDLVFTKRKQQEEALAEKRRKNGLVLKTTTSDGSKRQNGNVSPAIAPPQSRGLIGAATAANNASMKNLLQRNKTQRDLLAEKKKSQRHLKENNNLNQHHQHEQLPDLAASVAFAASGAFEFLKSEDGTAMLILNSEDGDASDDHDADEASGVEKGKKNNHEDEEEEDPTFEEQMMNAATKIEDFFWKHTVTEKITHKNVLKLFLTHAKRSLKKNILNLVEKILFSSTVSSTSTPQNHCHQKQNQNQSTATAADPDFERIYENNFTSPPFQDDSNNSSSQPAHHHHHHQQQAPSVSLNSAIEACIKLLDSVVYKLDKPWLDLPTIAPNIILPLNKFWRDLQRCCSDMMTNHNNETEGGDNFLNNTIMIISERQKNKLSLHRNHVRLAREVVNLLVCLTAVIQHRRRYVAKECEIAKRHSSSQSDMLKRRRSSMHSSSVIHAKSTTKINKNKNKMGKNGGDENDQDEEEKEEKQEELKIPKYKHDMWLGLRFLVSTSAGVLQSEGAVQQQLNSLFPGCNLDGISVEEIDVEQENKLKSQLLKEEQQQQQEADKRQPNERHLIMNSSGHHENEMFVASDDESGSDDEEDNMRRRSVTLAASVIPRPQNQQRRKSIIDDELSRFQRPEMIKARVGIGSHMQVTMIPLLHKRKSRQQVEAETATFLAARRKNDDHIRVVERAFDQYLLQSRLVEMRKKLEEDEKKEFAKSTVALITHSSQQRSIFNIPVYTTDFPREPRRNFALTLGKGDREEEQEDKKRKFEQLKLPPLMSSNQRASLTISSPNEPSTPLFLIKDRRTKQQQQQVHPYFIFMTEHLQGETVDDVVERTGLHRRDLKAMTPQPFISRHQNNNNNNKNSQKSKLRMGASSSSSSWTPSPDSKLTSKNENRLYGRTKMRTMWGVSPGFEVSASTVSRSLQLKPKL